MASSSGFALADPSRRDAPELYKVVSGEWKEAGPAVVFTADDGYRATEDGGGTLYYMSFLKDRGVKGTFFWSVGHTDEIGLYDPDSYPHGTGVRCSPTGGNSGIPLSDVIEIKNQGHELGTHGWCHEPYAEYLAQNGPDGLERLLHDAQNEIYRRFDVTPTAGAYPGGQQNEAVRLTVSRNHDFYRSSLAGVVSNPPDPYRVEMVDIGNVEGTDGELLDSAKSFVQEAAYKRTVIVFLIHCPCDRINARGSDPLVNVVDPLIQYIQNTQQVESDVRARFNDPSFRLFHGIPIQTFGDAMMARTATRGAASMEDTSGNAYFSDLRSQSIEVVRDDESGDRFWFDFDEVTGTPYYDSTTGANFEYRKGITVKGSFEQEGPAFQVESPASFLRGGGPNNNPALHVQRGDIPPDANPGYEPVLQATDNRGAEIFSLRNNGTMSIAGPGIVMPQASFSSGGRMWSTDSNMHLQSADGSNIIVQPGYSLVIQGVQGGGTYRVFMDGTVEYRNDAGTLLWRLAGGEQGGLSLFRPDGARTAGLTSAGELQLSDTALGVLRTGRLENGQLVWG